ncbi:MAG: DUF1573 domain-containing protein [Planctomycetota bacterium]
MQMLFRSWFLVWVVLCWAGPVSAAVTWSDKTLDLAVEPGAMELVGAFAFTNEGESAVTVTSIRSSCGCTAAALEKKVYGPGESGQITATFTLGDRVGKQVKKIVVRTDDPATPVTTLTLRADIPRWAELSPRLVMWRADEALDAKTVEVVFHDAEPVVLTAAGTDAEGVTLAVEELEAGRRYAVTVSPEAAGVGAEGLRALVRIEVAGTDREVAAAVAKQRAEMLRFLVRVAGRPSAATEAEREAGGSAQVDAGL